MALRCLSKLAFELDRLFDGLRVYPVPVGHRFDRPFGFESMSQDLRRNGFGVHDRLAEGALGVDDDFAVHSERPPANGLDAKSREFQTFEEERIHDAFEGVLAPDKVEKGLFSGFLDDIREDGVAVRLEALSREGMAVLDDLGGLFGGAAEGFPTHAVAAEGIDEADLQEIPEAEGQGVVGRDLALPEGGRGAGAAFRRAIAVALQPTTDPARGDSGQPGRLGDAVDAYA